MKYSYRGKSLTSGPAARIPKYLWARCFNDNEDLDENGHAPETLNMRAPEHDAAGNTRWINYTDGYTVDTDNKVIGFRKANGDEATEEELQDASLRNSKNSASDSRFCQVFNHSHECKLTWFKNTESKNLRRTKLQSNELRAASASGDWYLLQGDGGDEWAKHS